MMDPLNALCKWRRVFMNWQLGNKPKGDHEADAVVDHREATMLCRAELNAMTALLIQKGVFTELEFTAQLEVEAEELSRKYSEKFPGYAANETGITMTMPEALQTAQKFGLLR